MSALVLIGPMGAGKTSIGRRVAKILGVPFTDTDAVIVREHGAIDRIFADHGEAHFRTLERDAVLAALDNGGVVALGGGAILEPVTRAALLDHRVALLTVSGDTVASRLRSTVRPLLQGEDPVARWHAIYEARRPLYERTADAIFDTSAGPLQDVVDAVARWATTESPEERP